MNVFSISSLLVFISVMSALSAVILYREQNFDGGYYPQGGMQAFGDALAESFKELGGTLSLSALATKIQVKDRVVQGVVVKDKFIEAKYVVSNCDVRETFLELIDDKRGSENVIKKIKDLRVSASAFITYLGVDCELQGSIDKSCTYWFADHYNTDEYFARSQKEIVFSNTYLICAIPSFSDKTLAPAGCDSLYMITGAPFKDKLFWKKNKKVFSDHLVERLYQFIPRVSGHIAFQEAATPFTAYRYTLNSEGAFRGWAPILGQCAPSLIPTATKVSGLFLCGHWVTQPGQGGIPMVVNSGKATARIISKKINK